MHFRNLLWLVFTFKLSLSSSQNLDFLNKRDTKIDKCSAKITQPGLYTIQPALNQASLCFIILSAPETSQIRINVMSVGSDVNCDDKGLTFINGVVIGNTIFPSVKLPHARGKQICRGGATTIHADLNAATILNEFGSGEGDKFARILIWHVAMPMPPCHFVVFKPEIPQKHVIKDQAGCQALITRPSRISFRKTEQSQRTTIQILSKNSMDDNIVLFASQILPGERTVSRDVPCRINIVAMKQDKLADENAFVEFDHAPLESVYSKMKTIGLINVGKYICGKKTVNEEADKRPMKKMGFEK